MANFDSGVKDFVKTQCTVTVYFPIDFRDRAEIACKHCPYLSSNNRMCQLNKHPIAFPEHYVGQMCPLEEVKKDVQ